MKPKISAKQIENALKVAMKHALMNRQKRIEELLKMYPDKPDEAYAHFERELEIQDENVEKMIEKNRDKINQVDSEE